MKYLAKELQVGTRYYLDEGKTASGEFKGLDSDGDPQFINMSEGHIYIEFEGVVALETDGNDFYYSLDHDEA